MVAILTLGCGVMAMCVSVQCYVVAVMLRVLLRLDRGNTLRPTLAITSLVLMVVMLIMVAGNLLQACLWAALFVWRGEFADFETAFYHSMVNFTTLGYGDLVMSKENRLLGVLEAANGVLMFGLTTSVLFAVLNKLSNRAWQQRVARGSR